MTETINGRYHKIDNLDDAVRVLVELMLKQDSSVVGIETDTEIQGETYIVEVKKK